MVLNKTALQSLGFVDVKMGINLGEVLQEDVVFILNAEFALY